MYCLKLPLSLSFFLSLSLTLSLLPHPSTSKYFLHFLLLHTPPSSTYIRPPHPPLPPIIHAAPSFTSIQPPHPPGIHTAPSSTSIQPPHPPVIHQSSTQSPHPPRVLGLLSKNPIFICGFLRWKPLLTVPL